MEPSMLDVCSVSPLKTTPAPTSFIQKVKDRVKSEVADDLSSIAPDMWLIICGAVAQSVASQLHCQVIKEECGQPRESLSKDQIITDALTAIAAAQSVANEAGDASCDAGIALAEHVLKAML